MADYTLSAKITGDSAGFSKAFASASNVAKSFQANMSGVMNNIKSIGAKMSMVGAGMTAGLTMPFLGAVKSTAEFEDSMNKVRVTLLGGQKETTAFRQTFSGLQADALQLAAKFPVNAQEVADSMLELAKSGNNANAVMDMMPGILSAASAAGENVATTSNTVSAAINGFGLKASDAARVADILTNSANASKAGIADMGEVFKYAAPTAKTLGISIEELSAASGLMMDKGLEASQVGTSLTMAFTRMVKPTKQAQEVMDKLGFSAVDSKGNFKSLSTIVGELNTDMKNYTPAQKTAALATIMGTEAGSKFLMLMDSGADKIKANTKAISERGTAEKTAAEMQKSLSANIETMQGSLDALVKSIMGQDTPAISALTQKVTGLVDGFNNMSDSTKGTIATIAAIAAAIGPVLLVLGPLTTGLGTIGSALVWLTTPIGLLVGVLAALAAGFAYMMATNSKFAASVTNVLGSALSGAKSLIGGINNAFAGLKGIFSSVGAVVSSFASGFVKGFSGIGSGLKGSLSQIVPVLGMLTGPMGLVMGLLKLFGPQITEIATSVGAQLMPAFNTLGQAIGQISSSVIPPLVAVLASVAQIVMQVATQAFGALLPILPQIAGMIGQIAPLFGQLGAIVATVVAQIAPLITMLVSGLSPVITTIFGVVGNLAQAITNLASAVLPIVTTILTTIMNLITTLIPIVVSIATAVVSVATTVISALQPIIAVISLILTNTVNLVAGIIATVTPIVAFIAGIISSIMSIISPIAAFIGGVFSTAVTLIGGAFQMAYTAVASFVNASAKVIGGIVSVVTSVSGAISRVFNSLSATVGAIFSGIGAKISGVFAGIRNAWTGLTGFVSGIFSGISSAVQELVGQVKGFVNGVIGGINGAIGLINKIPGVSIGRIPQLARGTSDFDGGFARMNEGGRGELTFLPNGTQVIPHDVSMRAAREQGRTNAQMTSGTPSFTVTSHGDQQIVEWLRKLYNKDQTIMMDRHKVGRLVAEGVDEEISKQMYLNDRWGGF